MTACHAEVVAVPVERVAGGFFSLRSGVAGDVVRTFVDHRIRPVIVGTSPRPAESDALGDFVREADRGGQVWFVPGHAAPEERPAPA